MPIKLTQFIIGDHSGKTDCQIIMPQEENNQNKIGRIFFISENAKNRNNQKMRSFFQQEIKKYYKCEIPRNTEIDQIKIENLFENFLYNLNHNIHNFIKQEKLTINLNELNLLVGLIYCDSNDGKYYLSFSQIGKLDSLLIHPVKNNLFDILQIKEDGENKPNPFKIFSNVINGKIKESSSLIFCTNNILDYISLDKLKTIAERNTAENISVEIKNLLSEVNGAKIFAGIIIKIEKNAAIEEKNNINIVQPIIKRSDIIDNSSEKIEKTVKNSTVPIINAFRDKVEAAPKFHKQRTALIKKITCIPCLLKNLPYLKKILLIAIIIFIALFTQNILHLKNKKNAEENNLRYIELTKEIKEKEVELAAAKLINNNSGKIILLAEIEDLIKKLPQNSQEQKTKLIEIQEQIKELNFKKKLITEIKKPKSSADFNKLTESPIIKIIKVQEKIYALALDNNFFEFDLKNSSIKKIGHIKLNMPASLSQTNIENNLITLHQDGAFSQLQAKKNEFKPLLVKFPESNARISAISSYGKKLYAIDTANNQIYKYSYTGDEFSAGQKWLKEDNLDLSKAISIAIDGSIYILNSDKTIFSFFKGEEQEFQFENNDILLSSDKIWTDIDSDYLYILDAEGKKITILNKKGELIIQYYSDEFNNLKDFIVDETSKKIYALSDNKIFEIDITHI